MTILEVKNLKKIYNDKPVVNDLSFHVNEGEIIGLLGPNGAGKTTAFYMTIGLIESDGGNIFFKEKNVSHLPIHKRALMGMGFLSQEPSIFKSLSVEENILTILETMKLSRRERKAQLEKLLKELGLEKLRKQRANSLSGGERRRLEITRALAREPSLLLLDEPFANIDPIAIQDVKNLILLLKKKKISVLITDHNARETFSIVDRGYIIYEGRVILYGTPEEIINNKEAKKLYLGETFSI